MRSSTFLRTAILAFGTFLAGFCVNGQQKSPPVENTGLPPRASPADYQYQAKVGTITIAAEFADHSVPTPEGPLSTEDFVVVETGIFGAPGARLTLSPADFSLRINGKKPTPSSQYLLILKSLKDPTWEAPELAKAEPKSKGGLTNGNSSSDISNPSLPPIVHVPIELQRSWNKRAEKASLPEGDRALPQAGLLFFQHSGKTKSLELLYDGPAGKAKLTLQ
ncbi:MAG TPA: hypothetical protein VK789_13080 [Bryobacteraceae bacterium]|jgi:hypothetical protein|nr:hypothetical protein [Bryobacteraceae bacterium]